MTEVTAELYAANIPKCCEYQTMAQHEDMMLCWGLVSSIKHDHTMNCGYCELNTQVTDQERKEEYERNKTWRILNDNNSLGR